MPQSIFTVDVSGKPTLCFNAADAKEAIGICALKEFRVDLMTFCSQGSAICNRASILNVRPASDRETVTFKNATTHACLLDGPVFMFLVAIDGEVMILSDP
jgi:hypothetical protein